MNINDRSKSKEKVDPLQNLMQCADGFVVVGYLKGTHEKFAHFYASDNACNDALTYFNLPVHTWMDFGNEDENDSNENIQM
jgi:hypothetical protein